MSAAPDVPSALSGSAARTAVTAAVETRDADVDVDVANSLEDAAAAAAESTTALEGPVEAVRQAQAAWLAEQERVAAAEAAQAAAAAAAAGSRGSANPSNAPAQPASGSAAQPQTSGGADAGAATPAAAQVTKIQPGRVEYGADYVNISAVVTTNGPVAVTVTATISGRTVALSGPASVDGTATFSGSISGLAPGSYTWSVAANGLSTSARTIEVA